MITQVRINNDNIPFPYACQLPAFKNGRTYEFKEGVNIIVGENGCGKSTLMKIIKAYLTIDRDQCGRGIFASCIDKLYKMRDLNQFLNGADVYADYKRNTFCYSEISEMDNDTVMQSFRNFGTYGASLQMSRGQSVNYSMACFFDKIYSSEVNPMFDYEKEYADRPTYLDYIDKHRIEGNEWTLLMDEPDNNLSLKSLDELYGVLSFHKEQTQVIAVIHNPLLISRLSDKCNVIEMTKDYVKKIKQELKKWQ